MTQEEMAVKLAEVDARSKSNTHRLDQVDDKVDIPIRFIRSALPDGCDGYSVEGVYGMCGSAWRETLKEIHAPKNINELEARAG